MKGNDEMKNGKLQVALIGCGMIGHGHAEGVARDGRAEIAAVVYGKNRAAAEAFAKKYSIMTIGAPKTDPARRYLRFLCNGIGIITSISSKKSVQINSLAASCAN